MMICCNARMDIGADDNSPAIMKCQLRPGHQGAHRETFQVQYPQDRGPKSVAATWRNYSKQIG